MFYLAPFPAKMIIRDPASTAVWPYLGGGGVPEILGLNHREQKAHHHGFIKNKKKNLNVEVNKEAGRIQHKEKKD